MVPILSGVLKGTIAIVIFVLHTLTIEGIDLELRLFANVSDCVCYSEIKDNEDTVKLQEDRLLRLWARSWDMRFQPIICNIMQITRRGSRRSIDAFCTLEGTFFDNVEIIKYLGIISTNSLKWNTHQRYLHEG